MEIMTLSRTRYWTLMLSLLTITLVFAARASGNPVPVPPFPPEPDTTFWVESTAFGIAWLAIVNLAVDLFLLSLLLYLVCRTIGTRIGSVASKSKAFVAGIIGSSVVVSIAGAFIDFYLLLRPSDMYGEDSYVLVYDLGKWIAAVLLIFASILVPCYLILKLKPGPSALVSGIVAMLNPAFWLAIGEYGEIVTFLALAVSLVMIMPLLSGLALWHAGRYRPSASSP